MIKFTLCPSFSFTSFIVITSIIQILYFFITIIFSNRLGPQFLQPDTLTLISFGAKYPYSMEYRFQIWRFLTPVLLHGSFMHLFSNILSQMIFGTALEKVLGKKNTLILYILSAFGGVLFSSLLSDSVAVGASTAIFGIFGCYISFLIINWSAMGVYGPLRYYLLCIILMIILFNFMSGTMADTIDNWGHLGGLGTGLLAGFVIVKPMENNGEFHRKIRIYSLVILVACLAVFFICFYTLRDPKP